MSYPCRERRLKNCPQCGREIDDSFKYCPFDATFLGTTCPTCGRQWEESYEFCPFDATQLTSTLASPRQSIARSAAQTTEGEVDSVPHRSARMRLRYAAWTGLLLLLCVGLWGMAWSRMEGSGAARVVGLAVSVIGVILLFYVAQVARRARREVKFRLRRAAVAMLLYGFSAWTLLSLRYSTAETLIVSILFGLTPLYFMRRTAPQRKLPPHVRRKVIARDLKGKPFDPNLHQIDHIVPLSKGGDTSVENLRVIPKSENLQKGAKMPRLRDLL